MTDDALLVVWGLVLMLPTIDTRRQVRSLRALSGRAAELEGETRHARQLARAPSLGNVMARWRVEANGHYSAALSALTVKAKLSGHWADRGENKTSNVIYAISDEPLTEEEWAAKYGAEMVS
jgi:hypothetical protein